MIRGSHLHCNVSIKPLASAGMAERLEDLGTAVAHQGARIDSIGKSLEELSANVANVIIELGAKDPEQSAVELVESYKQQTESRMEAIENALKEITDKVANVIPHEAGGAREPVSAGKIEYPLPPKEGRSFAGHHVHVRGVLDVVLRDLLKQESGNYGGNESRALAAILWEYFGRPQLSHEIPRDELEALKQKYPAQDRSKTPKRGD